MRSTLASVTRDYPTRAARLATPHEPTGLTPVSSSGQCSAYSTQLSSTMTYTVTTRHYPVADGNMVIAPVAQRPQYDDPSTRLQRLARSTVQV